jgi:mannose-6-phosphate isomerase-like protein (cupin superfamily)
MTPPVVTRTYQEAVEITAGDGCQLRELLHPHRDAVAIGYSLAQASVGAGKSTLPHRLKQSEVYFGLSGTATLYVDFAPYPVAAGTAVYIPPGAMQYVVNDNTAPFVFLCLVDPPWCSADETIGGL